MRRMILGAICLAPVIADAAEASGAWQVHAVSSTRVEHYDNTGATGVYPFEGRHGYTDLQFQFQRAPTPFNRFQGYVLGLVNESDYRGPDDGFVLENFHLGWQLGDTALPFRAQAGDFLAFYSQRTLQRPLKGAQIELQPKTDLTQSLMLTAGTANTTYADFDLDADRYLGLSYTVAPGEDTSIGLNLVQNERRGSVFLPDGEQWLASLTLDRRLRWSANEVVLEGEVAYLDGDVVSLAGAAEEGGDAGYFAQLSGRGRRYDYRVRFEDYGEHFRPNGGVVVGDRRSAETHAGWRFGSGMALRGRWQRYEDARSSARSSDTETVGVRLTAPWLGSTALDVYRTSRESEDGFVDTTTSTARVNLAAALNSRWSTRVGAFTQTIEDDALERTLDLHQLDLAADRRFAFRGFAGSIGAGLVARARRGDNGDLDEIGPTFRAFVRRPPHDLRFTYAYLGQRRQDDLPGDNDRHTASLQYSLFSDRHRLTLEADYQRRAPELGTLAAGNRIALTYTFSFARTPRRASPAVVSASGARLLPVNIGMPLSAANTRFAAAGSAGGVRQQDVWVHELHLLDAVPQRQRVVLTDEAGHVGRAALIVDFDSTADPAGMADTYARVREALVERLGPPVLVLEQGEFTTNLTADIERHAFVRILEWDTAGGRLRFGIPARMDGAIRMEAQVAATFPPARAARWSIAEGL